MESLAIIKKIQQTRLSKVRRLIAIDKFLRIARLLRSRLARSNLKEIANEILLSVLLRREMISHFQVYLL